MNNKTTLLNRERLLSLDFMRGLIMVLLALEMTHLYIHFATAAKGTFFEPLSLQFFHAPWRGLRFWDIVQPAFMFMAGVAMTYSLQAQKQRGASWNDSFAKTLKRSCWLFFWGVLIYAVHDEGLSFELWNVLTQLAFTTLVAFLLFNYPIQIQILMCLAILLLTEALYRFVDVPNFDKPFTDQHNIGNYIDLLLMNKVNSDGWVAINCLPTAVHTIAGTVVGKLLISYGNPIRQVAIAGACCLAAGYGLDFFNITPIIKRIATSSFTLASLGWCLWGLTLCYWWIDLKNHKKGLFFFTVIGMNSIFIYLFFEIVGSRWFNSYIEDIVNPLLKPTGLDNIIILITTSLFIFSLEWLLCYFLYRKKIFFRL